MCLSSSFLFVVVEILEGTTGDGWRVCVRKSVEGEEMCVVG